ncbi:MAG: anaerobic sulfatase maturase [Bacteroidales bacterium]|nr:anaerobic sulfatase maturase [Bacteroidales bacterium]
MIGEVLKNTLTLSDACRITQTLRFNLMFKPIGSACNLKCSYCYYLDKAKMYGKESVMPYEILEKTIKEYLETNDSEEITFDWHGGEPLLLGLDYLKRIVELQNKYKGKKNVFNTIQTNATLMTPDFANFFHDNNFLVGVSIDGPQHIHDGYRKDKGGYPTFNKVMRGVELLHRYGVDFNTMTTINKAGEGRGLEVYDFLKRIGSHYMQFMPVLEYVDMSNGSICSPSSKGSVVAPWSVDAVEYGKFMCDIFDAWVKNDVGNYFVNLFDSTLANYCGHNPGTCVYSETCGANAVVEHNGDVYPCDHFVYPQYKLGNINESSLGEIVASNKMIEFGINKRNMLPDECLRCRFFSVCHGECPKHRFDSTSSNEKRLNSLCKGLKYFFSYVEPYMVEMRKLYFSGKSPSEIMLYDSIC